MSYTVLVTNLPYFDRYAKIFFTVFPVFHGLEKQKEPNFYFKCDAWASLVAQFLAFMLTSCSSFNINFPHWSNCRSLSLQKCPLAAERLSMMEIRIWPLDWQNVVHGDL